MAKRKVKQDKQALVVRGVIDENLKDLKEALTVFVENVSSVLREPDAPGALSFENDSTDSELLSAIIEYRRAAAEIVLLVRDMASQIKV